MKLVIGGKDELVAEWVSKRIHMFEFGSTPYTAIGLMNEAGVMLAGVVYQNFTYRDVQVHIAAVPDKRWMCKRWLGEVFRYPFEQLKVHRLTGLIPAGNAPSQSFAARLGFKYEGRVREMLQGDEDLLVFGMLRRECRFLNVGRFHGPSNRFHEIPRATASI